MVGLFVLVVLGATVSQPHTIVPPRMVARSLGARLAHPSRSGGRAHLAGEAELRQGTLLCFAVWAVS